MSVYVCVSVCVCAWVFIPVSLFVNSILQGLWARRSMLSKMKKNTTGEAGSSEVKKPKIATRWEKQFVLMEYPGLFEQYLSMGMMPVCVGVWVFPMFSFLLHFFLCLCM